MFVGYIHPFLSNLFKDVPKDLIIYLNVIFYIAVIVDVIVSYKKAIQIERKIRRLKEMGEQVKYKLEEIKKYSKEEAEINIEKLQDVINELKGKQIILNQKLYKHLNRLKKAFPTMKSEKITEFLNQKVELSNLTNKFKKEK